MSLLQFEIAILLLAAFIVGLAGVLAWPSPSNSDAEPKRSR